jgi:glyoxylase-like metal-dependent hydrolase (beta-lactamase superfamily II)
MFPERESRRKRSNAACLLAAILLAGCNSSTPEQQFVDAAARALGGRDRIQSVTTFVIEGSGSAGNLGQDMTWQSTGQTFTLSDVHRVLDVTGPRSRVRQTRTPNFLYFQGPQPQQQVVGFDGDVAYTIAANGTANRQSAAVGRDRRIEFYHHPLTMVRAMLDAATTTSNVRADEDGRIADVRIGDTTFEVQLDSSGVPTSVSSPGYHPNMGDVTTETSFADYRSSDGLTLPMRLTTAIEGRMTTELQVDRYDFAGSGEDAAAPAGLASGPAPTPPAPVVEATEVARGVWLLAGQSHHSALVELADHLVLIEAPQNEARTRAVIAKARELVPGKPLSELVMSHHHFDHSGGLRAAVSEGLSVITHKGNAAFVEEMIKRSHSRQPDALHGNPQPLTLRTVDGELTLGDTANAVVVYALEGNPHADTMVIANVPRSRVLIEADAFSPGGTYHPYAANLLDTIRARKLRVDRIVPLHGTVVSLGELAKAVAAQ